MDAPYNSVAPKHTIAPKRPRLTAFSWCWAALLDWQERVPLRERLCDLSDRELRDIGITRGEIDYVVANRSVDPRSVVYPSLTSVPRSKNSPR
ncbi:uncharacterized protein YjiS (DUF1127 family) [Bradyrhizobium algeriense]|uniref:Uncharacterized protein YjiS (DUF1127 family) n=1 Tax=Bradyrhizobium algeriense TaxID=634784 RepID=A0ABU8BKE3_9BRAD